MDIIRYATDILASSKPDDLKLYDIFNLYKDDLKENYSQLYYALLAWQDYHKRELCDMERELFDLDYKQHLSSNGDTNGTN